MEDTSFKPGRLAIMLGTAAFIVALPFHLNLDKTGGMFTVKSSQALASSGDDDGGDDKGGSGGDNGGSGSDNDDDSGDDSGSDDSGSDDSSGESGGDTSGEGSPDASGSPIIVDGSTGTGG